MDISIFEVFTTLEDLADGRARKSTNNIALAIRAIDANKFKRDFMTKEF